MRASLILGAIVGIALSDVVAGEELGSVITWAGTKVTAFPCDILDLSGPVQVLHEAPIEQNNIEVAFFDFGDQIQDSYRLDNYDSSINQIIQDTGGVQASRVNAASMFVDEDESRSNYPLAAFVFDPNDLQSPAQPAYLCRFDPVHLECFSTPLFTRGLNSAIPFVGKIVGSTYFYANGLGVDDRDPATNVRKTRPLFLVRDVNENEPDFDSNEYYINRVDNFAMRCADLTAFDKLGCFNDNGEQSECVTTDNLPGTSSVVSAASTFLTCIAQDAVGIILIALDDSQTPFAYNWVEGVDVRTSDGQIVPPVASPDDDNMAERQLLEDDGLLGPFGGCYALAGDLQMQLSPRTFCSSNEGSGLFEIRLPIEMGYCESSWATIDLQNDDGTVRAVSCKRFAPICPECAQTSNKPLLAYVADSDVTNRNDGLNCDQTLFDPPPFTVPSLAPSSVPTSTPSVSPTLNPTSVPTQAPFPIPTPAPSPEPTKDKPKCKGFYKKKDKNRYCWDHKNLFHRPYTKIGGGITEIKLYGRHSSTSSWHWWGVLEMPRSGKLKFRTTSADGSQVWLFNEGEGHDGERPDTNGAALIVDNTRYRKWGVSKSVASDWIHVKKGEKRVMHVFYGQKRRRTRMVLRWKFQHAWYKTDMKPFFPCSDD